MSVLPLYNALPRAGVPEAEAQVAAEAVAGIDQVATKADLQAMEARLEARITLRLAGWALVIAAIAVAILLAGMRWMLAPLLG